MEVTIGDTNLYTECDGEGPSVILIHGAGAYAGLFEPVADDLKADFRVLNYDRRGNTRSPHKPVKRLETHVDDAAALINAVLKSKAIVVGWSAGANIALSLSAKYPDLVRGLVLCEPSFLLRRIQLVALKASLGWEFTRMTGGGEKAAARFYSWVSQYRGTGKNAFDLYDPGWKRAMIANHKSLFAETKPGSGAGGERLGPNILQAVTCPVHILEGEKTAKPFSIGLKYFRKQKPDAEYTIVPGASHMIPTDSPSDVCKAVRAMALR